MNINLHIEKLVLEGLPLSATQSSAVQAALEAELSSLLTAKGLPRDWHHSATAAFLRVTDRPTLDFTKPAQMGHQIAGAVMNALGNNNLNKTNQNMS